MKNLLLAVSLLALAVVPLSLGVLPADAAAGTCTGDSGVTVVVEFSASNSQVGCAEGDPSSGYQALTDAGFTITYAQGGGAGAVCRINGYPSNNNCGAMPPASAYWAYFHGTPGSAWEYSNVGGNAYDPKPGTVEGWRFLVTTPKPTPTPKVTKAPIKAPRPTPTAPGSATASATASATPTPTITAAPTDAPTDDPTGGLVPSAEELDTYAAPGPVAGAAAPSEGNSTGWVVGIGLVTLLGTAGAVVALKRRQE